MDWEKELGALLGSELTNAGMDKLGNPLRNAFVDREIQEAVDLIGRMQATPDAISPLTSRQVSQLVEDIRRHGIRGEGAIRSHIAATVGPVDQKSFDLVISAMRSAGAIVESAPLAEANPFHSARDGKFTSPEAIVSAGKGSKSFQFSTSNMPDRSKGGRIGKDRSGKTRALIKWVAARRPCGRRARMQGKDRTCHGESTTVDTLNSLLG